MFAKFLTILKIPELKKKILLTLFLLFVYRMGFYITLPSINQESMQNSFKKMQQEGGTLGQTLKLVELFSASNFGNSTIFGLGIMPYISASIILQLLASVYPPLEKLQKEGEAGRKKINEYTRYLTVALCLAQSFMWIQYLTGSHNIMYPDFKGLLPNFMSAVTMTAGTIFLMWLGEQIDEFGIGNGISLLIMAGILSGMPGAFKQLVSSSTWELGGSNGRNGPEVMLVLLFLFIGVVAGVVFITAGQRKIPTQSAKHVRGRKVYGGGARQYLPLRINQAGVMPIIFASSLLLFPYMAFKWFGDS